jgi:hypothetical protein
MGAAKSGCVWSPTCVSQGVSCKSSRCPLHPSNQRAASGADAPVLEPLPDMGELAKQLVHEISTALNYTDAKAAAVKFLSIERQRVPGAEDTRAFAAALIRERQRIHVSYCVARCDYARQLEELAAQVETKPVE